MKNLKRIVWLAISLALVGMVMYLNQQIGQTKQEVLEYQNKSNQAFKHILTNYATTPPLIASLEELGQVEDVANYQLVQGIIEESKALAKQWEEQVGYLVYLANEGKYDEMENVFYRGEMSIYYLIRNISYQYANSVPKEIPDQTRGKLKQVVQVLEQFAADLKYHRNYLQANWPDYTGPKVDTLKERFLETIKPTIYDLRKVLTETES